MDPGRDCTLTRPPEPDTHSQRRLDYSLCAREPIHTPSSIQPHGVLLVLDERDLVVTQVSENIHSLLGVPVDEALGQRIGELLGDAVAQGISGLYRRFPGHDASVSSGPVIDQQQIPLGPVRTRHHGRAWLFNAAVHRVSQGIVLELELTDDPPPRQSQPPELDLHWLINSYTLLAEAATTLDELCQLTAAEVRRLTGFDRVLIYQFDAQWNGTVVGEDRNERLPSYLHHRFPAADIPAQARELYRRNRLRMIPDAGYQGVPLSPQVHPASGKPLDMSFSMLRSVAGVHVQYMKNMQTAASMSASILRDGQLWGLISCHHLQPKGVPYPVRSSCDLIARAFSLRLLALEHQHGYERRLDVRAAYSRLLSGMAHKVDFATALAEDADVLLSLAGASGAAILSGEQFFLLGQCPSRTQVQALADWLFRSVRQDVYATDHLASVHPAAACYTSQASGLLAVAISKVNPGYVMWFRPEVIQTIKWGGDPNKVTDAAQEHKELHPRQSFATWQETVRQRAVAWEASELEGAAELRGAIVGTVLRKAEELAELNAELARSNKDLEAFSYSVSHDLRAPLRHIAGYAEMLSESLGEKLSERDLRWLSTIIESSEYAGRLVDKLLSYSRLGRAELQLSTVDFNRLLAEIRHDVMRDACDRRVDWLVAELPAVSADLMMLRMALRDLLSNAVKYTRNKEQAVIEVGSRTAGTEITFWIKDNGVGFDMQYADKLFGVFQRLHRWEDYEGTGIGLANVRRVIERHGGRTWADAEEGKGATFYFTLPKLADSAEDVHQHA